MSNRRLPAYPGPRPAAPADPMPLPAIPPSGRFRRQLRPYVSDALEYFLRWPHFEFVRAVGTPGIQGGAWLFTERRPRGNPDGSHQVAQFVVKWYNAHHDFGQSASEYQILNMLRGPEHIAQLTGGGFFQMGMGRGLTLEYIAHGTLWQLISRFQRSGRRIPERLAWRIFLCLSRACVAMRWPPPFPSTPHSEKLPPPGYPVQVNIRHGDMHANNVLVGGLVPGNKEHEISPIIKLIDFGHSIQEPVPPNAAMPNIEGPPPSEEDIVAAEATPASQDNIHAIGSLMQLVVTGSQYYPGENLDLCEIDGKEIETDADVERWHNEPVTEDLRDLVFRCMALDPEQRPTLRELVDACEVAVYDWPANFFEDLPDGQVIYETDAVIKHYIQALVLDAEHEVEQDRIRRGRRNSFRF